jgi:hypothetical protein
MTQDQRTQIREGLSEDLKPIFDRLVEEYKFQALRLHGHPFVSYKVLGALVEEGWRPIDLLGDSTNSPNE